MFTLFALWIAAVMLGLVTLLVAIVLLIAFAISSVFGVSFGGALLVLSKRFPNLPGYALIYVLAAGAIGIGSIFGLTVYSVVLAVVFFGLAMAFIGKRDDVAFANVTVGMASVVLVAIIA